MSDEQPEQPGTMTFASDKIAELMWHELDPSKTSEPLTLDRLNAALRMALLNHFADLARAQRERTGRKPN